MKREISAPRPDFEAHAKEIGFHYASTNSDLYWDESARYVFSLREIEDKLERPTRELHALCLQLVARVVANDDLLRRLAIPPFAFDAIKKSWARRDASLYGRFDFAYGGVGDAKLLEYNADTPTGVFESAVVQWFWLEQMIARGGLPKGADQFNSLHEKLIARWHEISLGRFLHLSCMSQGVEDAGTVAYLEDCARQAGLRTLALDMGDIGLDDSCFVDRQGRRIDFMFKLYPWEWMFADEFGRAPALLRTRFVEPPWKTILSGKGMLALLWDMAPGHPNLLPSYFEDDPRAASLGDRYARKPLYSREGADIELIDGPSIVRGSTDGYGAEGYVRQALCPLPDFDGSRPVLGSWLVGDAPAGMGIREDISPITSNRSRFVPHVILG
ncbi:MAG TPA: glutathionylspermidine synthase family protein [Methylocystis sp.]